MKKYLKKEYILIPFIFICILSIMLIRPLGDLDEIWNYNVARNIQLGKIPYKDINTITTPLLPLINSFFLKIFADELIIMRIISAVLGTAIIYMVFKILKKLLKETNITLIFTLLIAILFRDIYCIDYNYMTLFITLLILYIELKGTEKSQQTKKTQFIQGLFAGLAICTKQSIGLLVAIATIIYPLIEIRKKQDIKETLKKMSIRILGAVIPIILLLIYLLITGSLKEFINYAIQGVSTFKNTMPYKMLLYNKSKEIVILSVLIPIFILITILTILIGTIKKINKPEFKNIQTITLYSLPMLVTMYPIADKIHFCISIVITLIGTIYLLVTGMKKIYKKIPMSKQKWYQNKLFIYKTATLLICIIIIGFIINYVINNLLQYINSYKNNLINKTTSHYKYIEIPEYLQERIDIIGEYINQKKQENVQVCILDAEAAVYNVPQDIYIKDYDMLLKGNLGKAGEQGQIDRISKEIQEETKRVYLIKDDINSLNWQVPTSVITYVKENLEKQEQISIYDVYQAKKGD